MSPQVGVAEIGGDPAGNTASFSKSVQVDGRSDVDGAIHLSHQDSAAPAAKMSGRLPSVQSTSLCEISLPNHQHMISRRDRCAPFGDGKTIPSDAVWQVR